MRLYPRMYPMESIQWSGLLPGKSIIGVWAKMVFRPFIVRSNIDVNYALEPSIDINAIEQRARAERSAWMGSKLKSYYEALVRKFERAGEAGKEDYLAVSKSLSDLEDRIRRYERSKQS